VWRRIWETLRILWML